MGSDRVYRTERWSSFNFEANKGFGIVHLTDMTVHHSFGACQAWGLLPPVHDRCAGVEPARPPRAMHNMDAGKF
jgi:hypothetical protein